MTDHLQPDPITRRIDVKTVPLHFTEAMEAAAVEVYERMIDMGIPQPSAIAAAARAAIVAGPEIDAATLRVAPPGSVIVAEGWIAKARAVFDRCKVEHTDPAAAQAALHELRNLVEQILPAVSTGWRGTTAPPIAKI